MKNNEKHTFGQAMAWLMDNGYSPINWGKPGPCDPGDFAGRHESILMEDGTWLWATCGPWDAKNSNKMKIENGRVHTSTHNTREEAEAGAACCRGRYPYGNRVKVVSAAGQAAPGRDKNSDKMNAETKELVSESNLIKSIGRTDNGVEIYQHPTKGKFAVLEEGNVTWDEGLINAMLDEN